MAQLNIKITLDGINKDIDANQIANQIEAIVQRVTGLNSSTTIYDQDNQDMKNPIYFSNMLKKVR